MIEINDYQTALKALRHQGLAQALYEKSPIIMADVLLTLEGDAHRDRRASEYRVFNRHALFDYEKSVFPQIFLPVLASSRESGQLDLVEMGYRIVMNLTADFAGIDRHEGTLEETDLLLRLIKAFSAAATIEHSNLDHDAVNQAALAALDQLDNTFLQPAIARRQALMSAGREMPKDVLSALLQSKAQLAGEVLRREIAFYLQAGAHSTANSIVHAMHEILTWCEHDATRRERILSDRRLLQRCVHEALRLHPASPVSLRRSTEALELAGHRLQPGDLVCINLEAANRDPLIFGDDANDFRPTRDLPRGVRPFGLSFGFGIHACLGRDLDGGVVPNARTRPEEMQMGIVALIIEKLLINGARWIEGQPPEPDPDTARNNFSVYPIALEQAA